MFKKFLIALLAIAAMVPFTGQLTASSQDAKVTDVKVTELAWWRGGWGGWRGGWGGGYGGWRGGYGGYYPYYGGGYYSPYYRPYYNPYWYGYRGYWA